MAGEGLFFTGQVLKNNRDLLKEEAARKTLAMQQEQLKMQQENLAMRRKENARRNAPKYEDFGSPSVGGFSPSTQRSTEDYINYVSNNPDNFAEKAIIESNIKNQNAILADITNNFEANMLNVSKGGAALDQANYVKNEDGRYEFERRLDYITPLVNSGEMSAEEARAYYYNNTDGSLYKVREETSLGQGMVDSYKGKGTSSELYDSDDGKKTMIGWSDEAKNAVYTSYKNELKFNNKGVFETPSGEKAYFNAVDNNELRMVLFFRDKKGKLTTDENSPILTQLDPKSDDFDKELSNEYLDYLAKIETNPFMVNEGFKTKTKGKQEDPFKDAYPIADWERMSSSQNFTENKYGDHGRMLTDFNFTQNVGGEHDITPPTLNNMQVSSDSGIDSELAKKYVLKQLELSGGKIKSKLSQVAISEDHTNMYGIYSIQVSKDATDDGSGSKGSMVLEISVPIDNIDSKLLGPVPKRWYNSLSINKQGAYNKEESTTTGSGAYDNIAT